MRTRLEEIVRREVQIVVGRAPRNNVGEWHTRRVETAHGARGFDFYATKDRAMAQAADCGLML
ncbi:MAG TPA: hypothetical protein VFH27_02820 [Longimicrobiaceae bacterium]|nr:hypothetical protein [Longimicrobiaceae bacterium]